MGCTSWSKVINMSSYYRKDRKYPILLIILLVMTMIIPVRSVEAAGTSVTQSYFDSRLAELRNAYPNYSTWTGTYAGGSQCWGFARLIADSVFGGNCNTEWSVVYSIDSVAAGDILQYGNTSGSGHTVFVTGVSGSTITFVDCNGNGNYSGSSKVRSCGVKWDNTISKSSSMFGKYSFSYLMKSPGVTTEQHGRYMDNGFERTLSDGNYYIVNAADPSYFLDIDGVDIPAAAGTNVHLYHTDTGYIGECDVWTLRYENGFYTITQMNSPIALDVDSASDVMGHNVHVWNSNGTAAQLWAISYVGDVGYRLQARCSGYSLDINAGVLAIGQNIQQWSSNDTYAQRWLFIPYRPEQPLKDGRYILTSASNESYELDVPGNTADVADGTALQVWEDSGCQSRYNSFDIKALGNGYYTLTNAATGKLLTSQSGATNGAPVTVNGSAGGAAVEWAITPNGSGYSLRARNNGLALDLNKNNAVNGEKAIQWPFTRGINQTWMFIPAEHSVTYDADGWSEVPGPQTKYYKASVVITDIIPEREGFSFLGWSDSKDGSEVKYRPGDRYEAEEDLELFAIWKEQSKVLLPDSLEEIGEEAFAGSAAVTVIIPEGCSRIGKRAFADCESLLKVMIPGSISLISEDAFEGSPQVVLRVYENSAAFWFAQSHDLRYEIMED